jgi:hypothetical protein
MLGADVKGGLAKLMNDRGLKIHSNKLTADVVTNVVRFLPEEDLVNINKAMGKYTELTQPSSSAISCLKVSMLIF